MTTKQKIISLIIKKQTYKDLKPIITQISKQNTYIYLIIINYSPTITTSIQSIQQILTKQYNAQSKLYALRFLKDCFEMGSKGFIKLTDQVLLPLIVNIVIESTDEAAITRYAGSSFTKSTDLTKFKSIIVSFFRLAKQSLCKWALWVPNSEYKFKASFISMQMKGINFQSQFKYYRPQNQSNFIKNCKQNGFQLQTMQKKPSGISSTNNNQQQQKLPQSIKQQIKKSNITNTNKQTLNQDKTIVVNNSKNSSKITQRQQQQQQKSSLSLQSIPQLSIVSIGQRYPPKSNNKHVVKCHQIFKQFDERLKKGVMKDEDVETMKNQINSQLQEYMGTPDLNQTQMQAQLTSIFENIKNCSDDYAKFKQKQSQSQNNNLSIMQSSISKMKNTIKKTQPLSTKKNQRPLSPINKLQTPMKLSPKEQGVNNQPKHLQIEMKKQTPQVIPIKEEAVPVKVIQKKQQIPKVQVFDDSSMIESQIKPNQKSNQKPKLKIQEEVSRSSKKVQSLSNLSKKINQALKEEQKSNEVKKSSMKASKKGGTREYFDSQLSISHTESSRVNFSESSNDQDSNDEDNKISANFKKQRQKLKLSSIAEEEIEKYGESSRRINNQSNHQSNLRRDLQSIKQEQRRIVVEKSSLLPSEIKVPKSAIDNYENKIRNLQQNLQVRQQKERQLSMKLNELNQMKLYQERQLDKIKVQNSKIMQRFSNAVDGEEYGKIRKDFDEIKDRNKRMEGHLEKLLKQIQDLKLTQKAQAIQQSHIAIQNNKQNNSNSKPKSPKKIFQSPQKLLRQSMNKKPVTLQPQKPKYTFQQFDPHEKRIPLSKIHEILDENNLNLLKKNIIGGDELFYTSDQVSFVCRTSPFKNQRLTLQLQLSFQFKVGRRHPINPSITIPNIEEAQVWKKHVVGDEDLFHLDVVVKLKKFPFSLMRIELAWDDDMKKSVYLPLVYWNFLRKGVLNQLEFDKFFDNNAENVVKSKVFNLNTKVVKDLKSFAIQQGYNLVRDNRMCFKLYEQSQMSNVFWCQLTNLSRQKCILKIVPQPFNQEMANKADQLIRNILFVVG